MSNFRNDLVTAYRRAGVKVKLFPCETVWQLYTAGVPIKMYSFSILYYLKSIRQYLKCIFLKLRDKLYIDSNTHMSVNLKVRERFLKELMKLGR